LNHPALAAATATLSEFGIVAYPTEYCYGLGCDPMNRGAVQRILQLKKRAWSNGLIVIAADLHQLSGLIDLSRKDLLQQPCSSWPGPHTWLLPALPRTPRWIRGEHNSVAVRVTAHPIARTLCRHFGSPIVSTSANRSGRPPLRTSHQVRAEFEDMIDFILEGPVGRASRPSSIRDTSSGNWVRGG
jgi:L-threonylcarbamoyladenylate synthase